MLCCLGDTTVTCISELLYVFLLSSAFHCRNGTTTKLSSDGSAFASTVHKQQGDERGLNTVAVQNNKRLLCYLPEYPAQCQDKGVG